MNSYEQRKNTVRNLSIWWQTEYFPERSMSQGEMIEWENIFSTLGGAFGLMQEFHENGIC